MPQTDRMTEPEPSMASSICRISVHCCNENLPGLTWTWTVTGLLCPFQKHEDRSYIRSRGLSLRPDPANTPEQGKPVLTGYSSMGVEEGAPLYPGCVRPRQKKWHLFCCGEKGPRGLKRCQDRLGSQPMGDLSSLPCCSLNVALLGSRTESWAVWN